MKEKYKLENLDRYTINFLEYNCYVYSKYNLGDMWEDISIPYFTITKNDNNCSCKYTFYVDDDLLHSKEKIQFKLIPIREINLHCKLQGKLYSNETDESIIIRNDENALYQIINLDSESIIKCKYKEFNKSISLDLFRLVRGVLEGLARNKYMLKSHMSCVSIRKQCVSFVGVEGAGKTSFMLSCLKQFSEAELLTNDKSLLEYNTDAKIRVIGLPYAVSIGQGALEHCNEIKMDDDIRIIDDEIYIWHTKLVSYLNKKVSMNSELGVIVQVEINPDINKLQLQEITDYNEKANLIEKDILSFSDKVTPYWLLEMLNINISKNEIIRQQLLKQKFYKLYGNPWIKSYKEILYKLLD
ncbi:hypothetical protein CCS79_14120 [Clostridium diolis]|uniref:hypothetical protein n=1 Tax=Clostridium diolis TaxID=223919 RepID=UPI000B402F80|nr:hypothetical protein [Clostridium diolis]OVE67260.1 hypothetical protein CCS79_14120 [Clostridium diolis]